MRITLANSLLSQHLPTEKFSLPSRPTPFIPRTSTQPPESSTPPINLILELSELLDGGRGREVGPGSGGLGGRDWAEGSVEGVDVPEEGHGSDGD